MPTAPRLAYLWKAGTASPRARRGCEHAARTPPCLSLLRHPSARKVSALGATLAMLALTGISATSDQILNQLAQQTANANRALGLAARSVAENLTNSDFFLQLGQRLLNARRAEMALGNFERAVQLDPASEPALIGLGETLRQLDREAEAVPLWLRILEANPEQAGTQGNLGRWYWEQGELELAIRHLHAAARLSGDDAAWLRVAEFCWEQGNSGESLEYFDRAFATPKFDLEAEYLRGLIALSREHWEDGWKRFEYRRALRADLPDRGWPHALWDGSAQHLTEQSILVRSEGRLADDILFAGWLPELVRRAGSVTVECAGPLRSLFARSFPRAIVPNQRNGGARCPTPHWQTALGSLSKHLGLEARAADVTTVSAPTDGAAVESAPGANLSVDGSATDQQARGYLRADWKLTRVWQRRIATLGSGRKIGAVGFEPSGESSDRCACDALASWWELPGIQWLWLPRERRSSRAAGGIKRGPSYPLHTFRDQPGPRDMEDWAGLFSALDLVVAPAGTLAHLAAALGVETWVMVPAMPSWCWGLHGERSRWYPSARLFRQEKPGDWSDAIALVAAELGSAGETVANSLQSVNRPSVFCTVPRPLGTIQG